MLTSEVYECKHCAAPYGKPHDPDCVLAALSPTHDDVPDGSVIPITATKQAGEGSVVMDWFEMNWWRPLHQMPPALKDMVRHVWKQGVVYGRRSRPPRWLIFIFGLFVGVAWSLLVMQALGVFTK